MEIGWTVCWIAGFALVILLIVWVLLKLRSLEIKPLDKSEIYSVVTSSIGDLKLMEAVGDIKKTGEEMKRSYREFEKLLEVKQYRGEWGEFQLQKLLKDILPEGSYAIRQEVKVLGKTPDAYIETGEGIICIDSKFSLDNYRKMVKAEDPYEREQHKKRFQRDVKGRLEEVKKYIKPEVGTTSFAFAFIPSEAVFYYLTSEELPLILNYSREGVILVSPIRLCLALNLLRDGIVGRRLSEQAEKVQRDLKTLSTGFKEFDRAWVTFKNTHLENAYKKATDVDEKYRHLKRDYEKITEVSLGD